MIRLALKLVVLAVLVVIGIGLYHHLTAALHAHSLVPALSHLAKDAASRLAQSARSR